MTLFSSQQEEEERPPRHHVPLGHELLSVNTLASVPAQGVLPERSGALSLLRGTSLAFPLHK